MKKVIIAGGRDFNDPHMLYSLVNTTLRPYFQIDEEIVVLSGRNKGTKDTAGADRIGEDWAIDNGIKIIPFPPDWTKYGLSAGPRRNEQMAEIGDILIAFLNVKPTKGTSDMIDKAIKHGLTIHIYRY